ncbi:hypothetical protein ACL9RI_05270 [Janthinobacterium sp. Mn2066]|uniref:hypothetical protein n=1 Tax=Janthinobacterium sp. Mn2066 TaxID=3395264 RepID=UPI003BE2F0DD
MFLGLPRLSISLCLLLCAMHATAQELIPAGSRNGIVTLGEAVRQSSMIVRLKIASTRPVIIDGQGRQDTCGFIYVAKVLDTLKGTALRDVTFFVPSNVTTADIEVNYLAFLKYRSEPEVTSIQNTLSDSLQNGEDASVRCKFPSGYYMPSYLTLMPFDLEAARQFGGVWLSLKADPGKPELILCQVAKTGSDKVEDKFNRRKISGDHVTSWTEVSRLIKKANGMFSFLNRSGLDECSG